jgi:hypothetical protein
MLPSTSHMQCERKSSWLESGTQDDLRTLYIIMYAPMLTRDLLLLHLVLDFILECVLATMDMRDADSRAFAMIDLFY